MPRYVKKSYEPRECENCRLLYVPRSYNQRVCTPACRKAFSYAAYQKPWYLNERVSNKPLRNWYKTEWEIKNPGKKYSKNEVKLWHGAKARAEKSGIAFTIEVYDIEIPDECPIYKVPFVKNTRYAASLDRIDSSKGYIPGNIWVISKLANRIKTDATQEELETFAKWVLKI